MAGSKRHVSRDSVAAFDPSPRWPAGYFQVLEELGIASRNHGFYAHWVRQFFNAELHGRRRRDLGVADIEHSIGRLREDPSSASWQVGKRLDAQKASD